MIKSYGSIYGIKTINEYLAKALLLLAMVVIASIKYEVNENSYLRTEDEQVMVGTELHNWSLDDRR